MIAFLIVADIAVAAAGVASIDARCDESSLHGPEHAAVQIVRKGDDYSDGKRAIDAKLVNELAAALQAAPVRELPAEELAPSPEQLHQAAEVWAVSRSAKAPRKKAIHQAVEDRKKVVEAVRAHWQSHWSDDYPSCQVELILDGNRHLSARTKAQQAFMIPWQVGGADSWSPRLGRALAALLPEKFLQRQRLSGARMAEIVVEELGRFIE